MAAESPKELAEDLRRLGFAVLQCPAELSSAVAEALGQGTALLRWAEGQEPTDGSEARGAEGAGQAGLSLAFKRQGLLKERLQIRRLPPPDGGRADGPAATLERALAALESVAQACFEAAWASSEVPSFVEAPAKEALRRFADRGHLPVESRGGGKGKSVLNLYHYFNEEECEDEPCREHADPGLLTILCRSSNPALQVQIPHLDGERAWADIEPEMDAFATADEGSVVLLAAVGETLERLSAGKIPACRHRVVRAAGRRFNMAYEMRPRMHVWYPWAELVARDGAAGNGKAG